MKKAIKTIIIILITIITIEETYFGVFLQINPLALKKTVIVLKRIIIIIIAVRGDPVRLTATAATICVSAAFESSFILESKWLRFIE